MDEALKNEWLGLMMRHTQARDQIKALRQQQLAWHKRITEIETQDMQERSSTNPKLAQVTAPSTQVAIGK